MHFDLVAALISGFVGTVVMTALVGLARDRRLTRMPLFELVTGAMVSADEAEARRAGLLIHFGLMGTVVFGVGYGAVFALLDSAVWLDGLILGLIHGLVVGMFFLPQLPALHPRVEPAPAGGPGGPGGTVVRTRDGVRVSPPGVLGKEWGGMTPVGLMGAHAVYGIVVAVVYGLLA